MNRQSRGVALVVLLIPPLLVSPVCGADSNDALAAIKRLGGRVRPARGGIEVEFHLRGRNLSDDDLAQVAQVKEIVALNLKDTKVTSAGLRHLAALTKLRRLHLERTLVSDEGIAHLSGLTDLEYLNLFGSKVTDEALTQLTGLKKLRRLYVWETKVTEAGAASIEKKLPDLKVIRGLDLSKIAATFPKAAPPPTPKVNLDWVTVTRREDAPARSENGINVTIIFENKSAQTVKLYWIEYGGGNLKLYGQIAPGATRRQNSYARNAWLVTNQDDQPLGYFVVKEDDSLAVIPPRT